ncbi:MAG: peptidase S9 [Trueperella sp.]|uniref:peptidase S9 n=1 Tax=Trueperella sp. TaxID=2699835 RepID=UPI0025E24341|nr:peptidase S9 [Trueperella sp.]MCI7305233.1 peptidase S9 [Trueperella sp.]MDY5403572.1 peptidase S9 [Trueperella sp.]
MPVQVPQTSAIRALFQEHPEVGTAGSVAALSTLYYALPDFLRRRPLRIAARVGCIAAITAIATHETTTRLNDDDTLTPDAPAPENPESPEDPSRPEDPSGQESPEDPGFPQKPIALAGMIAAGIAALAGSIALDVALERRIFARGERRRAAGVRLAHTRQALWIGPLSGVATYLSLRDADRALARSAEND